MPGKGLNELRAVLADRTGKAVWTERLTAQDEPFRQIEGPDPMAVTMLLVSRVGPCFGLNEETRKHAKPSRLEAQLRRPAKVVPSEDERSAIKGRLQTMKNALGSVTLLVVPTRANGTPDTASAAAVARQINEDGLCRAVSTSRPAEIPNTPGNVNEVVTFWTMATAFRDWVRQAKPDGDYILFIDCAYTPGHWEQGFVHAVVCDRRGDWVITDLQNSDQEDYQAAKPTSIEACDRLAVMAMARRLR